MDTQAIFGLQSLLSLLAWGVIVGLLIGPRLARLPRHEALMWLAAPHAFRHVGLVFLVPGVVDQPLPAEFANPAAYGDLATGVIALTAIVALHLRWSSALALVWIFNIVGTIDLVNALRHADLPPLFGAAWYIPTMLVPLLLVTHFLIFKRLLARGSEGTPQNSR